MEHKHEFRQKLAVPSDNIELGLDEAGFYCIHCLLEVKNKKGLDNLG